MNVKELYHFYKLNNLLVDYCIENLNPIVLDLRKWAEAIPKLLTA